jgi:hypothetical protein
MFKIGLDNAPGVSSALQRLYRDQLPFAAVLTATELAKLVRSGETRVMKQRLDRPTPTTLNSLFLRAATKAKPEARVYFKDAWSSGIPADTYLQQAVAGGPRPHKRFEKSLIAKGLMQSGQFALPASYLLNQYGNVSRGVMTRILSGLGAAESASGYQSNATGSKRSKRKGNARRYFSGVVDGTDGVWERMDTAFGDALRPVFLFSKSAPIYRIQFPFFRIAENIVTANHARVSTEALERAIATAKR